MSAEELRQGVRSDAVVHYVRETGNAILKGLLRDRRGVGRALQEIDDSSGPFVSRRGWKRFVEAMAVERVRHLREMGLVKGRCYWGKGLDDVQTTPSLLKWFSPLVLRGNHSVGRPKPDFHSQVPARLPRGLLVLREEQPPGPLLLTGPGPPLWEKRGARGRARAASVRHLGRRRRVARRAALDVAEQLRAQRANNGRLHLRASPNPGRAALVFVGVPVRALRAAGPQAGNGFQMYAEDPRGARPRRRARRRKAPSCYVNLTPSTRRLLNGNAG